DGTRRNVVLRRYRPQWERGRSEDAAYEFRVLELLQAAGVPAPAPIFLDADGHHFGVPAMVLEYLAGRSYLPEELSPGWAGEIAKALAAVHAMDGHAFDLSWLRPYGRSEMQLEFDERRDRPAFADD